MSRIHADKNMVDGKTRDKKMPRNEDYSTVHAKLRDIMKKYAKGSMRADPDKPGNYVLLGPASEWSRGKDLWFGAVVTGKSYVSYHLIAVYGFPDLLEDISPELKKRKQGKACFNFKTVDETLFKELARLTEKSYQRLKKVKAIT